MKELGMSWTEIKQLPRIELNGLLKGLNNYNIYHAFDGYSEKDIPELAKNNPNVRGDYARTQEMIAKYSGKPKQVQSFRELVG
jgi:hypothetical protein